MNQSVNRHRSAALRRFAAPILLLAMANASMAAPDYGAFAELLHVDTRLAYMRVMDAAMLKEVKQARAEY